MPRVEESPMRPSPPSAATARLPRRWVVVLACLAALLAASAAAAVRAAPAEAVQCGGTSWMIGTSYGWSEGRLYVSGYYVYNGSTSCSSEYMDIYLPPDPPPEPEVHPCEVDPDSRACVRRTVGDAVRAALQLPECAALAQGALNPASASPYNLFWHLNLHNRIYDGGPGTGAVASAPQGAGYDGHIMLWDRFFGERPALFPDDRSTQTERRTNIVIEELMHLSNAMPANHAANGRADNYAYWGAIIRQRCQPGASQVGVSTALRQ